MNERWDSVCLEAHSLVFGDRGALYDHPHDDYARTCRIFEAKTGIYLTPAQGIQFMMSVKESRINHAIANNFPVAKIRDSVVDLAGYADCLFAELAFIEKEEPQWKQPDVSPKQSKTRTGVPTSSTDVSAPQPKATWPLGLS